MYEDLMQALIDQPQNRARIMSEVELTESVRREIANLLDISDAVWLAGQVAPAIEDDHVAALLGLVPNSECVLDPTALSRGRKKAGLNVSQLAELLRDRGWDFNKSDVFRWERNGASDVPPAVIQTVAEILGVPVDALVAAGPKTQATITLARLRKNPLFDQLAKRWARAQQVSYSVARASLEGRALATVHRGEHPDELQMLSSLESLVNSIEQKPRSDEN